MHIYIHKYIHTLYTLFFTDPPRTVSFSSKQSAEKHVHESVSTELCNDHLTEVSMFQQGNTLQLPANKVERSPQPTLQRRMMHQKLHL